MDLFPSPVERTVAAALLLLSNAESRCPSPIFQSLQEKISSESCSEEEEEEESLSLFSTCSRSKSKSSSLTSDDCSSIDNRAAHKLRFVSVGARSREIMFKVTRKRRSKVYWSSSDNRKLTLAMRAVKTSRSESTEASCLSSNTITTAASATRNHYVTRGMQMYRPEHRDKVKRSKTDTGSSSFSAHLRNQAEAILKLLSRGSLSEVRIRQQLGDSPDTSKALRILLKREEIKRSGMGGRYDPYIYKIA